MGKSRFPLVWKFGNVFALRAKTIHAIALKLQRTVVKFRPHNFLNRFRILRATVCEWWGPKVGAMRSGWVEKCTFSHVVRKRARRSLIKVIPPDSRSGRNFWRFYFSRFLVAARQVTRQSFYGRIKINMSKNKRCLVLRTRHSPPLFTVGVSASCLAVALNMNVWMHDSVSPAVTL